MPRATARCGIRTLPLLLYALNAGEFGPALQDAERAVAYAEDVDIPDLMSQGLAVRATVACMCCSESQPIC